jgi:thiosulfate/3-mercaptopyruvate sulfurtransferase
MTRRLIGAFLAWVVLGASAASAAPLVDAAWLQANLKAPNLVVLDIRNKIDGGSREVFEAGHIPGAVYSDYGTAGWRTAQNGVPAMLPPTADLEKLIGGLGIGNGSHVVIVPGGVSALDYGSATRVYWTFKVLGHDAVSILDGGYKGWTADPARPVEKGAASSQAVAFKADFRPELLASKDDVKAALDGSASLVDNRPADQYAGKAKTDVVARYGTIPGAVSIPQDEFFDAPTGRFAGLARLAELWKTRKVSGDTEQITFCNTGHWASLGWFASHELLGNTKTRLYDGSMSEWAAQADLPVEKGPGS